jgi:hypothetical protein
MQEEINQLKTEIADLKRTLDMLKSSTTIPFDIDVAFTDRLIKKVPIAELSTKDKNSENLSFIIDTIEYIALGTPDGFLNVQLKDGSKKYIPFYD